MTLSSQGRSTSALTAAVSGSGTVTLGSERIAVDALKAEIDRKPLEGRVAYRFAPAAAAEVVVLFALSALAFLLFALQGLLALIRYRSMVPLMYLWFLVDALIRRVLIAHYPTQDAVPAGGHAIGFYVNMGLLAVAVLGLALSLVTRTPRRAAA